VKVTVVGAGVVGCAIAYELTVRGAAVQLVDARGSGQGATRASAGMLAPYIEGHSAPLRRLGLRSLDLYDQFISRVEADSGRRIEYRRTGTLQVAFSDEEAERLESDRRALVQCEAPHECLDAVRVKRLEPALADDVRGGLLIPSHGYVAVATLVAALAEALRRRGTTLVAGDVREVSSVDEGVRVVTSEESIVADVVVLAAGCWSGGIPVAAAPAVPVRPIRGQLLQLRFDQPPLSHVVWGCGGYFVPWQDGRLLVGATVEDVGFDEGVTTEGVRQLLDRARALLPTAGSAMCDGARAGLRPATPDELPIIGPSAAVAGVFYATGHYRNGVLLAPLTAMQIADLVLGAGEKAELEHVRPGRFGL
jgi:glycine oxidase